MATAQTPAMAGINPGEHGHEQANPGEIAIGVIIGRTSEFFDFFVYAIASVIVFPRLVFPFASELTGTLYSFAIFALAFMARPLGTVIFMTIDREYGKTAKLVAALFLLGTATVALAFLPGYSEIGAAAIWLLALARAAQGLAWAARGMALPRCSHSMRRRSSAAGTRWCRSWARRSG